MFGTCNDDDDDDDADDGRGAFALPSCCTTGEVWQVEKEGDAWEVLLGDGVRRWEGCIEVVVMGVVMMSSLLTF